MTPTDSKNLDAFEQIYPRFDKCCIVAALISDDAKQLLRSIDFNESIELKLLSRTRGECLLWIVHVMHWNGTMIQ